MNREDYIANAKIAADNANDAMGEKFPNYMFEAKHFSNLGHHVAIDFANVASHEDAPFGIVRNASGHMMFMMHLSDNFGNNPDMEVFEIEMLSRHHKLKNEGVKFRKIKGKSPEEAMKKLVKWFEKNAEKIENLPK